MLIAFVYTSPRCIQRISKKSKVGTNPEANIDLQQKNLSGQLDDEIASSEWPTEEGFVHVCSFSSNVLLMHHQYTRHGQKVELGLCK